MLRSLYLGRNATHHFPESRGKHLLQLAIESIGKEKTSRCQTTPINKVDILVMVLIFLDYDKTF